jgi:hypothetical protein
VQFTGIGRTALILPTSARARWARGADDYLITGPAWQGTVPSGLTQIASPNNAVLVIGRLLVYSDSDLPTAYGLAKLIQITPLNSK